MLCFLPPVPAIRPDPLPDRNPPQTARAAQAVILIFVVLNVLFVLTGLLPIVLKNEARDRTGPPVPSRLPVCPEWKDPGTSACSAPERGAHAH